MSDNWKDEPHWVLRFAPYSKWELIGPDGDIKSVDWMGVRSLSVTVNYDDMAKIEVEGISNLDMFWPRSPKSIK